MAYNTAKIKDILPPDTTMGRIGVLVSFTGNAGEPEIVQEYWVDGSLSAAQLQAQVAAKAATLNSVETIRQGLTIGQTVSIVPPASPAPTAADTYAANINTMRQMNNAIALGVKTAQDADVVAMQNTLKTNYQDSFLSLF